jgi:ssDNA-binding Zn-finger/Zn-ribbon topoisomerase 1
MLTKKMEAGIEFLYYKCPNCGLEMNFENGKYSESSLNQNLKECPQCHFPRTADEKENSTHMANDDYLDLPYEDGDEEDEEFEDEPEEDEDEEEDD